jgi:hypothetical protein
VLHNRHIVDFLRRVSFSGGVQSATSGTKDQEANSFIFDAARICHKLRRVRHDFLTTANDGRTS